MGAGMREEALLRRGGRTALLAVVLVAGGVLTSGGAPGSIIEEGSEELAIWCPCTNSWVNRVSDCPDCEVDGLDIYASPPEVTVRGSKVTGQLNLANGADSKVYNFRFTWDTGDTLRSNGGFRVNVVIADDNSARWNRQGQGQGADAFRGRFRGTRPGRTTARFQLVQDGSDAVAYTTPPVAVVIRP